MIIGTEELRTKFSTQHSEGNGKEMNNSWSCPVILQYCLLSWYLMCLHDEGNSWENTRKLHHACMIVAWKAVCVWRITHNLYYPLSESGQHNSFRDGSMGKAETIHTSHAPITLLMGDSNHSHIHSHIHLLSGMCVCLFVCMCVRTQGGRWWRREVTHYKTGRRHARVAPERGSSDGTPHRHHAWVRQAGTGLL